MEFRKAVKYDAKARIALVGPSGSGKSMTMLEIATLLAGADGTIAALDTEHGSLSKYADRYSFSVIEPDFYTVPVFLDALKSAIDGGFSVLCVDSLSHFWMGAGGALEFVDAVTKRGGRNDSFGAWKDYRTQERQMIDAILAAPIHIITTMRTKSAYEVQKDDKGRTKRVKVGLAPIQADGLEYEFDLVGYMDDENSLIVDKTRCPDYGGAVLNKPKGKDFDKFYKWLKGSQKSEEKKPEPQTEKKKGPENDREQAGVYGKSWDEIKRLRDQEFQPSLVGDRLLIQVSKVDHRAKKAAPHAPFRMVRFYDPFEGHNMAFCFDSKYFPALDEADGAKCCFIISCGESNIWNIEKIIHIDGEIIDDLETEGEKP